MILGKILEDISQENFCIACILMKCSCMMCFFMIFLYNVCLRDAAFMLYFRLKKNMNNLVLSLAPKFTKLQTLVLRQDKPQLEDNAVEAISTYCHELLDLDLSKSFKLTDRSLYALAHGCPNLNKLNISGCSAFSGEALEYLTNLCTQLKILNLCGCVQAATDRALQV